MIGMPQERKPAFEGASAGNDSTEQMGKLAVFNFNLI
jgi:hypothetical protein